MYHFSSNSVTVLNSKWRRPRLGLVSAISDTHNQTLVEPGMGFLNLLSPVSHGASWLHSPSVTWSPGGGAGTQHWLSCTGWACAGTSPHCLMSLSVKWVRHSLTILDCSRMNLGVLKYPFSFVFSSSVPLFIIWQLISASHEELENDWHESLSGTPCEHPSVRLSR